MKKIYLDYAATSPMKKRAVEAMKPFLREKFGNASSIHSFGQEAKLALIEARQKVAAFFNCLPEEVIFTSGGTESDNLAIRGVIIANKQKPHIVTTQIEHHAVLKTCQDLEKMELAEATYVKPPKNGIVQVEDIIKAIKENTILISVIYANNEIGTIQPIKQIADAICKSKIKILNSKIYFHVDAVQAVEYLDCDMQKLGVDLLSFSGHKFGAPKGVGGLIVRKGVKILPQITGGEQEERLRAGTENVAAIAAMAAAIAEIKNQKSPACRRGRKIKNLRDYFIKKIEQEFPEAYLNGDRNNRLPNNVNFSFEGIEGESIVLSLDQEGIAASTGSACASGSLEPSHVLLALGIEPKLAQGAVRFTFGEVTTRSEIDYTVEKLAAIVKRLRKMSPFWTE